MSRLIELLKPLPRDATVPVGWVLEQLDAESAESCPKGEVDSWRERIWTVPDETRLTAREVAEALGHAPGWVYKRTMGTAAERLPHRKLEGGGLVFVVGELREWLRAREAA